MALLTAFLFIIRAHHLLNWLELKGCIITVDALTTLKEAAAQIRNQAADHVLALKGDHLTLREEAKDSFKWLSVEQASVS